jgi:Mn2+/Fe2+ NRAMP family transporter
MTTTDQAASLPTSSKVLCGVYALIAVAALIATWSQNLAYTDRGAEFLGAFWNDTKVNPAARSITVDIALFVLAAAILMVAQARKHGVRFVWAYIIGGFLIAISVTFPLFLIAREMRIAKTDPTQLRRADTIWLAIVGIAVAAFVIWVDVA